MAEKDQASPAELLADQVPQTIEGIVAHAEMLAGIMRIETRPEFDLERRLLMSIIDGALSLKQRDSS